VAEEESVSDEPAEQLKAEHDPDWPAGTKVPAWHAIQAVVGLLSLSIMPAEQLKFAHDPDEFDGT